MGVGIRDLDLGRKEVLEHALDEITTWARKSAELEIETSWQFLRLVQYRARTRAALSCLNDFRQSCSEVRHVVMISKQTKLQILPTNQISYRCKFELERWLMCNARRSAACGHDASRGFSRRWKSRNCSGRDDSVVACSRVDWNQSFWGWHVRRETRGVQQQGKF